MEGNTVLAQSSLARWLRKQSGPLSIPRVVDLVRQAAVAIQELHNQQIIHQNINPTSFLVQETVSGHLELHLITTDIEGSAAILLNKIFPSNSMPTYMAPEQWTGHSTPATDQYALAVLAYELLTGVPPFQGPPAQLLDSHMKAQPSVPSSIRPQITPALDSVLINALAKRPEDRFPSVTAFGNALFQALRVPGSMVVNVPNTTSGSLHAMLYISNTEATVGTLRTLILPQGQRVIIAIPKDAYDGQVIRIDHYDVTLPKDGSQVPVILTVVVTSTETSIPAVHITQPKQQATNIRDGGPVTFHG